MKRCNHSHWLGVDYHDNDVALLETDRLHVLTNYLQNPDSQKPSLIVLVGNVAKSAALRALFGIKKRRWFVNRRGAEIQLHLDPCTIFHERPIFLGDTDFSNEVVSEKPATLDRCHKTARHPIQSSTISPSTTLHGVALDIYTRLLSPFADVICFFSTDLGGFRPIAKKIAAWLERGTPSNLSGYVHPKVIVVSDQISLGSEIEARKAFMWILEEETAKDPFTQISTIEIVSLFPMGAVSNEARYRSLKDRIMNASSQVRRVREDTCSLFTATHFSALFEYACEHFAKTTDQPFSFIKASRTYNPVAPDLQDHLFTFLRHIREPSELTEFAVPIIASSFLLDNYHPDAHRFDPRSVFTVLYKDVLHRLINNGVSSFEESTNVILKTGFINMVEKHLHDYFGQYSYKHGSSSAEIHRENLERFQDQWCEIRSDGVCFACLRRRPQYNQPCGHCVCQTCVVNFGEQAIEDPWEFKIRRCFLCKMDMVEDVIVKIDPPTAGAGVLCLDGGGVRGVMSLAFMKRIQNRIGLPIPFQKFFKAAFGVSSGGLIVLALFHNGWSINKSSDVFEKLAKLAFQQRKVLKIPFISRIQEIIISYLADGLYPAANIEAGLQEAYGKERSILDCSYATSIGAKIGLPVATVQERPSSRLFTNYNGIGKRSPNQQYVIKPKDGLGKVPVWEIARSISAAPGFFPPKTIRGVGTFQDSGPLENDPLLSALSEVTALFPLTEEPDFVVSIGTGGPVEGKSDTNTDAIDNNWKNKAFLRLCRMFLEKMRDRKIRQNFQMHPRYHRLDIEFDQAEPRLDDTKSMSKLKLKVETDNSMSKTIDGVARCMIASLFYFELDSKPDNVEGKSVGTGHVQCSIRRRNPAFPLLLRQLSDASALFYLNDYPIPGKFGDSSCLSADGNFRKLVELNLTGEFTISLKQGSGKYNISGSPYSVEKLVTAQGLNAHCGSANHRKRKWSGRLIPRKQARS